MDDQDPSAAPPAPDTTELVPAPNASPEGDEPAAASAPAAPQPEPDPLDAIVERCAGIIAAAPDALQSQIIGRLRYQFGG